MKINRQIAAVSIVLLAGACTYEFPESAYAEPSKGDATFTKLITVGSSYTAGIMNGALYTESQNSSIPNIIAQQLKSVGGGNFNQPTINSTNGYYGSAIGIPGVPDGTPLGRLYFKVKTGTDCAGVAKNPDIVTKVPGQLPTAFAGDKGALNNFSAYGVTIQTAQLSDASNPASPFFNASYGRFASAPGTSTIISDAKAALTTESFLLFWLGMDDVYGYALNGAIDTDPKAPLTSNVAFTAAYPAAINNLLSTNSSFKGVVANIPDVTSLPHFTTVKWNQVVFLSCNPTDVGTVAALNAGTAYGGFNAALDAIVAGAIPGVTLTAADAAKRKVTFTAGANTTLGANPIVIIDENLPNLSAALGAINPGLAIFGQVRPTTANDLILLSAGSILPTGVGINPAAGFLTDKYVLTPEEQAVIQASITSFNSTIETVVNDNSGRLALVDANAILSTLKTSGASINGSGLNSTFAPPFGAFTLDGVHLTARGGAYMANKFIEAINYRFGSTIPFCNPNDFNGNELPIP